MDERIADRIDIIAARKIVERAKRRGDSFALRQGGREFFHLNGRVTGVRHDFRLLINSAPWTPHEHNHEDAGVIAEDTSCMQWDEKKLLGGIHLAMTEAFDHWNIHYGLFRNKSRWTQPTHTTEERASIRQQLQNQMCSIADAVGEARRLLLFGILDTHDIPSSMQSEILRGLQTRCNRVREHLNRLYTSHWQ